MFLLTPPLAIFKSEYNFELMRLELLAVAGMSESAKNSPGDNEPLGFETSFWSVG